MNDDWECPMCAGTGKSQPDCPQCEGNGWVDDEESGGTMTCPSCDDDPCLECDGTGETPEESEAT